MIEQAKRPITEGRGFAPDTPRPTPQPITASPSLPKILRDATIITEWDGSRWVNYDWLVEAFGLKPATDTV